MQVQLWLLILCTFPQCSGHGETEEPCESPPCKKPKLGAEVELEDARVCEFSGGRKSVDGKISRSQFSEVSSTCSGDLIELSTLITPKEFLGTKHELQLIAVRGSASFDKNFSNPETVNDYSERYICAAHRDELSLKWSDRKDYHHFARDSRGSPKCSYPDEFHGETRPATRSLFSPSSSVTFEEARAVMTLEKILLAVGLPVCKHHKDLVKKSVADFVEQGLTTPPPLRSGNQYQADFIDVPSINDDKTTYSVSKEVVTAFRKFASLAGESRLAGWKPIDGVEKETKQRKTCAARRLIDVIFEIIAKENKQSFAVDVLSPAAAVFMAKKTTSKYAVLMQSIADIFYTSPGRREKELAIAHVAKTVPLRELRQFIPGLSERLFYKAKQIAVSGMKNEQVIYHRIRYNPAKLQHFIQFITSPTIMSDLPFGDKKVVTSDGKKYIIPNSLRHHRATEIVHMYTTMMTEKNLGHLLFSTSTLYKILSYCAATERKASVCVDYFYSESELAFDDLNELVDFLFEKKSVSSQWRDEVDAKLKESRFYLKGDFRLHTRINSRVADHCQKYSLSDPKEKKLHATCENNVPGESHVHDLKCDRCELTKEVMVIMREALREYEKKVNEMTASDEQKKCKEDVEDRFAKSGEEAPVKEG